MRADRSKKVQAALKYALMEQARKRRSPFGRRRQVVKRDGHELFLDESSPSLPIEEEEARIEAGVRTQQQLCLVRMLFREYRCDATSIAVLERHLLSGESYSKISEAINIGESSARSIVSRFRSFAGMPRHIDVPKTTQDD